MPRCQNSDLAFLYSINLFSLIVSFIYFNNEIQNRVSKLIPSFKTLILFSLASGLKFQQPFIVFSSYFVAENILRLDYTSAFSHQPKYSAKFYWRLNLFWVKSWAVGIHLSITRHSVRLCAFCVGCKHKQHHIITACASYTSCLRFYVRRARSLALA